MMTFKRQQVGIATAPIGPRQTVEALVLGDLAVHRGLNTYGEPSCSYYVVTHVPTGYKLADGNKQRNCKRLVAELNALGIDWKFDANSTTNEFREKALPLIRAFISNTSN